MKKQDTIKHIKSLLDRGLTVYVYTQDSQCPLKLWHYGSFIMWQHYGQSAQRNTLAELTWLINNILEAKRQRIYYQVQ